MKTIRVLGVFALAMISINAILSLRSLPAMASLGPQAVSFFILAALCFLIPSALVCAELATLLPKNGGIYTWVRTAFGEKTGFMAIWMEWINNVISFPAGLATIVTTLAYLGFPTLATHKFYLFIGMLIVLWGCTAYNLLGIKAFSRLSILGAIFGTILPGLFIIGLGIYWVVQHPTAQAAFTHASFLPDWKLGSLAIFVSTLGAYSGMQITAFYAQNVHNPQKTFPKAILLSTILIVLLSILAALSMSVVLPSAQVNWMNGVIESFAYFFQQFHLSPFTPILAALIALGSIGSLSAWLVGPARGMRNACEYHPQLRRFSTQNRQEMPHAILILQAIICTLLSSVFLFMPSLKSAFWLLITLTSQFTVLMYILVFASALRLRKTHAQLERPYKVPTPLLWIACIVGIITCAIGFCLGLFPPNSIGIVHNTAYAIKILIGDALILLIPLLFLGYFFKKG